MTDRLIFGTIGIVGGGLMFALGVAVSRHKKVLLDQYYSVRKWEW